MQPQPFYYLDNFQQALDFVGRRHADLLLPEEREFLTLFPTLPEPARALLVRMVMRVGKRFRASRLVYAEIGPASAAAAPLLALGWLRQDPALALDELFALLTRPELEARVPVRRQLTKGKWLEALRPEFPEPRPFSHWWGGADDELLELTVQPLCDRLRLLFFGNLRQQWSEFVLADLGIFRYEPVAFPDHSRPFQQRADIDLCLALHGLAERLAAGECPQALAAAVPGEPSSNEWIEARRGRLLFRLGRECERRQALESALALYRDSCHREARARHIRVLECLQRFDEAHALAESALASPRDEAERQQLERQLPRLRRRLGLPSPKAPKARAVDCSELQLPPPGTGTPVELAVVAHLQRDEAPVFYVENALINSLFGLHCWEAIFAPLPGAFFHPFQSGPADLHQSDFRERRAHLFAELLARLDGEDYAQCIRERFADRYGTAAPFVHWQAVDAELLAMALACIPAAHLRLIFSRLLEDIAGNRAGFPDLIQFWPGEGRYLMIEVKGPGDRLQDSQRRWLDYFASHAIPAQVCHVSWA
jgi:hypothetical protein